MQTRLSFTVPRVRRLPVPTEKRLYFYDTATPGLTLCVTATGSRTYYLYKKVHGRPQRVRIGRVDEISLKDARDRARKLVGDIVEGKNPQAERIARRGEITLGELFDHYLEHHAKPHKRTWKEDQAQFDRYLFRWKNRPLTTIKKPDVQTLHARVGRDCGIYAANRLRSLIHSLFNHAADVGFEGANPARGVRKFKEQSRERYLQADEFPKFWKALEAEPSTICRDFFKVALLTGARKSNVLAMRWEQVSLDRGTWVIPSTKTGDQLTVALTSEVVAILMSRKAAVNGSPWVFPGHSGNSLKDPYIAWRSVLKRASLSNLRIHDLRRTMGSWQAAAGASLPIIGKSLGHKHTATTQIYARLDLDPVRESVTKAVGAMLAAANAKGGRRGKKAK